MAATVTFIDRTFDDALALLVEARNYIAYSQPGDADQSRPNLRIQISYETMRVTARLVAAMAWLLAEKAVRTGEITREQSRSEEFALSTSEACLDPSGPENENLPKGLRSLLDRSYRLYTRVARLEAQTHSVA